MFPVPDLFHGGIMNRKYVDLLIDFMIVIVVWTSFYLHCYTMSFFSYNYLFIYFVSFVC